jgi:para-aminobenzoate synthetase/4-amino-4-deoxychorismate lyase
MFTPGTVLLHDNRNAPGVALWFASPRRVLVAHTADELHAALAELEAATASGLHAAGFLAYEAGYAFEERLRPLLDSPAPSPLLWFGLYDAPETLTQAEVTSRLATATGATIANLTPSLDEAAYVEAFDRVQELIAAGDIYQANLTFKARFELVGDPVALYRRLIDAQAVAHGALIHTGEHWILSRSPELFVSRRGNRLDARPMKGTLRRGTGRATDPAERQALRDSEKNRAENLMIVDLLRNDLGRIAEIGSVEVTDLFTVETYRTLHTMTSGITARLRPGLSLAHIIANLFPCGSITGAPKLRAMEIIHAVEGEPRGVYTGAIGHFAPGGDFSFNVAIRTAVIDRSGRGEIGIGGGIVADSTAADEYREALLKMTFLSDPAPPVTLIETMLWERETGYALLDRHLDRLTESAAYFDLPLDREAVHILLDAQAYPADRMRVRLTLDATGPALTATPLPPNPERFRFILAPQRLHSSSVWLAHKTTNRAFYDVPRQEAHDALGIDEVLFRNERDELTEGSFTNLFLERDGGLLTPPLASGLLPGTLRAELLAHGRAQEQVLRLADLATAEAIWLGNSVRGLIRAEWVRTGHD